MRFRCAQYTRRIVIRRRDWDALQSERRGFGNASDGCGKAVFYEAEHHWRKRARRVRPFYGAGVRSGNLAFAGFALQLFTAAAQHCGSVRRIYGICGKICRPVLKKGELKMKKLILASASPRRREILAAAGYTFDIQVADVDENISVTDPALLVRELALLKAAAVAKSVNEDAYVIGSDTVVSFNGEIMGKPANAADAKRMLSLLSGNTHQVLTGVCIVDAKDGSAVSRSDVTHVTFKKLSEAEIETYIASGEPMDKAGAYAIQGIGGALVARTEGDLNNVIGFPLWLFEEMLKEKGTI